jgi:hypothetical protein
MAFSDMTFIQNFIKISGGGDQRATHTKTDIIEISPYFYNVQKLSRIKHTKYLVNQNVSTSAINLFNINRTKTGGQSIVSNM